MRKSVMLAVIPALLSVMLTYTLMKNKPAEPTSVDHAREEEAGHDETPLSGLKLTTEAAVAGESWAQITATGKVGPNVNKVVKVGPRIGGKIVRVYADIGDNVHAGQTLATLSSVDLAQARAAYRQAAAKVKSAKDAYDRQAKLAKLGAFSSRPVEEARSELNSAQGDLSQAKSELAENKSDLVRAESELAQCIARLDRAKELYKDQIVSRQDLEGAEAEFKRDSADVEAAKARIRQTEAKIQQAEARVGIAKTYMRREEKVLGGDLLASKELQAAKSELTATELELRAAADHIRVLGASPGDSGDSIAITSPITGRVVSRSVNLGEMTDQSSTLLTVMNLADVWVEANVFEKDLAKIRKGQVAQIKVNSYPDRVFSGNVTHVSDVLDPDSRTATIRCVVSNGRGLLKPEMFATINIITARKGGAVLIPKAAVLDDAGKKIVFTPCMECPADVKANTNACGAYDKLEVEVGPAHGDKVEVSGDIKPGTLVVTEGAFQLKTALGSGKLEAGCADH
jgi:cobalt-zinc-cadmium efflux system membrane fusion protein